MDGNDGKEGAAESEAAVEATDEMDELLEEVQKELHTRFKNMFEGDMLLPNLVNNPEFQGKDLLSLTEGGATEDAAASGVPAGNRSATDAEQL